MQNISNLDRPKKKSVYLFLTGDRWEAEAAEDKQDVSLSKQNLLRNVPVSRGAALKLFSKI